MAEDKRNHIRKMSDIGRNIALIGQLGISLVVPVLMCMMACYFLTAKLGVGGWIYIPGLILGIGSSGMTAWKFYQSEKARSGKKSGDKDRGPSYSHHY